MTTKPSTFVASLNWLFKNPTGQLLTPRSYIVCQIYMYIHFLTCPIQSDLGVHIKGKTLSKKVFWRTIKLFVLGLLTQGKC